MDSYQVTISKDPEDADWDSFLRRSPGGHHVQTSLWARLKADSGWRAVRLLVRDRGNLVAGAQVLLKSLPLLGSVGYVQRGPVLTLDDPQLADLVMEMLRHVAREQRIRLLVLQPPDTPTTLEERLADWDFHPTTLAKWPRATTAIDLTRDLEEIRSRMQSRRRRNIRVGKKKGITVREGAEGDIPLFHRLLLATGQRHSFAPEPESYYRRLWELFEPHQNAKLFFAYLGDEPVSAILAIPFGDTVIDKRTGWSGRHGNFYPNDVLLDTAIAWAKAHGYRAYDLEGIDLEVATKILRGDALSESFMKTRTATAYKLRFGGDVKRLPGIYVRYSHPIFRWSIQSLSPAVPAWLPLPRRFR